MTKCKTCRDEIRPDCDWRQGRCPHRPALWDMIKQWWNNQFKAELPKAIEKPNCHCYNCNMNYVAPGAMLPIVTSQMTLCPTCGNKRCPHATNHINPCTGSNDPDQPGSRY